MPKGSPFLQIKGLCILAYRQWHFPVKSGETPRNLSPDFDSGERQWLVYRNARGPFAGANLAAGSSSALISHMGIQFDIELGQGVQCLQYIKPQRLYSMHRHIQATAACGKEWLDGINISVTVYRHVCHSKS
jgi:hypothetical protein